ncbi:MAG: hypothetical protein K2J99_12025 [Lachnospiraceae bacterium]|nr:hypothetical protein [Lachnospiraceae bacterium]
MSGIGLAAFLILILGGSYYMTQGQMKYRREKAGAPPTWQTQKLTKEQQMSIKKQREALREELYKDYPQAARFMRVRRCWKTVLVLLYLLISVLRLYILGNGAGNTGMNIAAIILGGVVGCFIGVGLLLMAMGYKWKWACILYLMGFYQINSYVQDLRDVGINSWGEFMQSCTENFQYYPLEIGTDILSMIYALLIVLTAICLTLIPHNRRLAEQIDILNEQAMK